MGYLITVLVALVIWLNVSEYKHMSRQIAAARAERTKWEQ